MYRIYRKNVRNVDITLFELKTLYIDECFRHLVA